MRSNWRKSMQWLRLGRIGFLKLVPFVGSTGARNDSRFSAAAWARRTSDLRWLARAGDDGLQTAVDVKEWISDVPMNDPPDGSNSR